MRFIYSILILVIFNLAISTICHAEIKIVSFETGETRFVSSNYFDSAIHFYIGNLNNEISSSTGRRILESDENKSKLITYLEIPQTYIHREVDYVAAAPLIIQLENGTILIRASKKMALSNDLVIMHSQHSGQVMKSLGYDVREDGGAKFVYSNENP